MGTELLLRVFRQFYLEDIDKQWVEHLTNMEHLRDGIGLRGYGQRDPKQEYKKEGFDIFVNMMAATTSNVVTKLMRVRLQKETDIERLERIRDLLGEGLNIAGVARVLTLEDEVARLRAENARLRDSPGP